MWLLKHIFNRGISKLSYVSKNSIVEKAVIKRFCKLKNVQIGDYSYIANNTKVINTVIGNYCSIGPYTQIGLGMHPTDRFSTSPIFYSKNNVFGVDIIEQSTFNEYEKINIGNDVWVGAGVIILDGVKISDGAIIAAGSVVTKNVDPYTIVGGVPAKPIKKRFNEETIEQLLISKWWEKNIEEIRDLSETYNDVNKFIEKLQGKRD